MGQCGNRSVSAFFFLGFFIFFERLGSKHLGSCKPKNALVRRLGFGTDGVGNAGFNFFAFGTCYTTTTSTTSTLWHVHKTPKKIEKNCRKGCSVLIFFLDFSETLSQPFPSCKGHFTQRATVRDNLATTTTTARAFLPTVNSEEVSSDMLDLSCFDVPGIRRGTTSHLASARCDKFKRLI